MYVNIIQNVIICPLVNDTGGGGEGVGKIIANPLFIALAINQSLLFIIGHELMTAWDCNDIDLDHKFCSRHKKYYTST